MTEWFFFPGVTPISANTYYGHSKQGHRYVTQKGKKFQKQIQDMITEEMKARKVLGEVTVMYAFGYGDARARDVDNGVKHFQDCIKGNLFEDDYKVQMVEAWKIVNCKTPFIAVMVIPVMRIDPEAFMEYCDEVYKERNPEAIERMREICQSKDKKRKRA